MSTARVEIKGSERLQKAIRSVLAENEAKGRAMIADGAYMTQLDAVKSIQTHQSSGRSYTRRSVQHTASTAGNPPNTDTGNLVRNITVNKIQGGYDVGSRAGAPYGFWLEFGTLKMAPRPWLSPAFKRSVDKLIAKWVRK